MTAVAYANINSSYAYVREPVFTAILFIPGLIFVNYYQLSVEAGYRMPLPPTLPVLINWPCG